jgi:hypothetical protein
MRRNQLQNETIGRYCPAPYGNFRDALDRLHDGDDYCSGGKAEVLPALTLVKFPIELNRTP